MLTIKQAEQIAMNYLDGLQEQIGISLGIVKTLNTPFGYVFLYNSKDYIESGDMGSLLAGNAPFLIDAEDGSLHVFGTAEPMETYLQEYERSHRQQSAQIG